MLNPTSAKYFVIACFVGILGCSNDDSSEHSETPAKTRSQTAVPSMVDELHSIASQTDNLEVWHLNRLRAEALDEKLETVTQPAQRIDVLFEAGVQWLNAGEYDKSIDRFTETQKLLKENEVAITVDQIDMMRELLGVVYLRKGEVENCIENHNEYSCLIPIQEPGQHTKRASSERALEIFADLLDDNPFNLQTTWLYNITQMTLGGYPDSIDERFLIEESVFKSEAEFPRFTDKAMELGIAVNDISGSVVMDDFNNDHYLDLLVSSYGLDDQLRYFQNNRQGGFDDLTDAAGLKGLWSGLNMVQADYNNDGWVDVLVLRGAWLGKDGNHPNSLLRNNGNGTFTDVTRKSGLYCRFPTQTATWADFNNDGWIDLFIANEHSNSVDAPSQLFHNNGDGTFRDVATEKMAPVKSFIKGCIAGDYNNDGYPDVYISTITGENLLLKNGGPENGFRFENVSQAAGTTQPRFGFPCWFFDYDQDGWEDLFVSGFDFRHFESAAGEVAKGYLGKKVDAELPRLFRNNHDGTFSEVSKEMRVDKVLFTMGCNFGDLNNDGFPDFYAGTGTPDFRAVIPNRMFLNDRGVKFLDVTEAGGFGHLQKGHGVAFGDVDHDGDQDIYHVLGGSYDGDNFMNAMFVNPGNSNHWIKLKLVGTTCNKSAIGARIKIVAIDKAHHKRVFYSRVNSGASFGANPLVAELGLADCDRIEKVEIVWPGEHKPQSFNDVKPGNYYLITQGESQVKQVDVPPIALKGDHKHHH